MKLLIKEYPSLIILIGVLLFMCILLPVLAFVHFDSGECIQEETVPLSGTAAGIYSACYDDMRGVFVTTMKSKDYPIYPSEDPAVLKSTADAILDNCAIFGINTVFLQVRPCSDSFYTSCIFPCSLYLTGTQGKMPQGNFDTLAYWVEQAHARNINIQAWVDPFRITRYEADHSRLSPYNPAVNHQDWTVECENNYYYDPGNAGVHEMILKGIGEIVDNYDVDGIYLGDCRYPAGDFSDTASYSKNTTGYTDLFSWRCYNLDTLVEEISAKLSEYPDVVFGAGCSGIWANKENNILGSLTFGEESYTDYYCDSRKWAREGWLDYIIPQLNCSMSSDMASYTTLAEWWTEQLKDSDVKLYIGLSDDKACNPDVSSAWYGTAELAAQMDYNASSPAISGEVHSGTTTLINTPEVYNVLINKYK